jgi:hypothetical protein
MNLGPGRVTGISLGSTTIVGRHTVRERERARERAREEVQERERERVCVCSRNSPREREDNNLEREQNFDESSRESKESGKQHPPHTERVPSSLEYTSILLFGSDTL